MECDILFVLNIKGFNVYLRIKNKNMNAYIILLFTFKISVDSSNQ